MLEIDTPVVLVLSAGVSDLQPIIIDEQGKRHRAHLRKNARRLHQALLDGSITASISDKDEDLALPEWQLDLHRSVENEPISADSVTSFADSDGNPVVAEFECEEAKVTFVAPKLTGLHRRLLDECSKGRKIVALRVISTHREPTERYAADEPIALGNVLLDWFTPVCPDPGARCEIVVLEGKESLESNAANEQPELPAFVAERIDACLFELARAYPNAGLILAINGGMPPIKEYIAASARLYFRSDLIERSVHIRGRGETTPPSRPTLAEEARARRGALLHLRRGGFVEAYATAIEFHHHSGAESWVKPLQQAAAFMNRNESLRQYSPDLPILRTLAELQSKPPNRCLIPALRTEAALHAGHWPEAINWSMTFFDAALLDAIERNLPEGSNILDRQRRIEWAQGQTPPSYLMGDFQTIPLKKQHGRIYRFDVLGASVKMWLKFIAQRHFYALDDAYTQRNETGNSLRDYRNLNTHNRLTERELDEACDLFRSRHIWAVGTKAPGNAFLGQPLVSNVLTYLLRLENVGIDSPRDLYSKLIEDLEGRILAPNRPVPCATRTPPFVAV